MSEDKAKAENNDVENNEMANELANAIEEAQEAAAEEQKAEEQKAKEETAPAEEAAPAKEEAEAKEAPAAEDDTAAAEEAPQANAGNPNHKWYIIHAYSGFEKKVAAAIEEQAQKKGMQEFFSEIIVPTEQIVEVKKGKKVNTERKFFPGYVLAKMQMNDAAWHLVKDTPKVTGFIGGTINKPLPISEAEAQRIFDQVKEGQDAPRHKVTYMVGDNVKVIDGPFDSFIGTVEEIDEEKEKLRVSVSIFGRPTPLDLEYTQVEKA